MKVNVSIVFVLKAKTLLFNVFQQQSLFINLFIIRMIYPFKLIDDVKKLKKLADIQSKVKKVRLEEKLSKQGFQNSSMEVLVPIVRAITDTDDSYLRE